MIKNPRSHKLLLCLVIAILTVPATVALTRTQPQSAGPSGTLTVVGEVKVNGANAISGATVFSDSTVTTAKGSSAVVSLGKLGRVEVMPESTMKLSFDNSSITTGMLSAGRVRFSSSAGIAATAETANGKVVATGREENKFTVDTRCGSTFVATEVGTVEVHGRVVTTVPAGSDVEVGTPKEGCKR